MGLSALLVSTYRAMRRPIERETGRGLAPRFLLYVHINQANNYRYFLGSRKIRTINSFIMEKNKNEELQSRRDFFKKAAKGVLPILGAVVLSGAPQILKAAEEQMGCRYGCAGSCYYNCYQSCQGNCRTGCYTMCTGGCDGSCKGTCSQSCMGSCLNSCMGYCDGYSK